MSGRRARLGLLPKPAAQTQPLRYSRDQMLQFYKKQPVAPVGIEAFTTIFREEIDLPMAFQPLQDGDWVRFHSL